MTPAVVFFEHTADLGVRVYGATLPGLFANAARALYAGMGEWRLAHGVRRQKSVESQAESVVDLLQNWLSELLSAGAGRATFISTGNPFPPQRDGCN